MLFANACHLVLGSNRLREFIYLHMVDKRFSSERFVSLRKEKRCLALPCRSNTNHFQLSPNRTDLAIDPASRIVGDRATSVIPAMRI